MNQDSKFSSEKHKVSIVHKPFIKGQVNFFHPPKKNPNGHLASAQLWDRKEVKPQQEAEDILELEDLAEPVLEAKRESATTNNVTSEKLNIKPNNFFNNWKLTAIFLIILGNLIANTAIVMRQQQIKLLTSAVTKSSPLIEAGKTNLATQEFVELQLNNLKNIAISSPKKTTKTLATSQKQLPENLPLAIPPTNLPENLILPQVKNNTQYYYILANYSGDRSLKIAKTKVPNVSLINFPQGVFIYLGAFTQKEVAEKFSKNLQELGLESYIYPFE